MTDFDDMVDEQIKAEYEYDKQRLEEYLAEQERLHPLNFIEEFANSLYVATPLVHYDVAYACASGLFSACLPFVRLKTRYGLLPLAELSLIIGHSGVGKTLPLNIIRHMSQRLHLDLPEKYTTEGIEQYFARKIQIPDPLGKKMIDGPDFENEPYGMMCIDEISQMFGEAKAKSHLAGAIEEISQFWDMHLKATTLASGTRRPQDPYISIVGGMIPHGLKDLPILFFTQGLAGRFYVVFVEPKPTPPDINIGDYDSYAVAETRLKAHEDQLEQLLELVKSSDNKLKYVTLGKNSKAENLWTKHNKKIYGVWYNQLKSLPYKHHYQYIKRLAEMTLRQAGRNAVARSVDWILENQLFDIEISEDDMQKAINRSKINHKYYQIIIGERERAITADKGDNFSAIRKYSVQTLVNHLVQAPNQMLTNNQLYMACKPMDKKTYKKYRDRGIKQQSIVVVDRNTITEVDERVRLELESGKKVFILTVGQHL